MWCDVKLILQDVKLRNAFCLCHVLRMHAPETPYDNDILEVSRLSLPLCVLGSMQASHCSCNLWNPCALAHVKALLCMLN